MPAVTPIFSRALTFFLVCSSSHRPKWQYRLLLCTVIILFVSLVLVLTVSVLYGFNMALPHIRVVKMRALWEGKGRDRAPNLPPWGKCSFAERTFQKNEMTDQHFFSLSPIPPDECPSRPPPPPRGLCRPHSHRLYHPLLQSQLLLHHLQPLAYTHLRPPLPLPREPAGPHRASDHPTGRARGRLFFRCELHLEGRGEHRWGERHGRSGLGGE